jgi:hypothetical protein
MSYNFSSNSCPIALPPLAAAAAALPIPYPCQPAIVSLAFTPPSSLPWLVIASALIAPFLPRGCLLTSSLCLLPPICLVLPGWLLRHFSLCCLHLTLPLILPPPLIDTPAGCCVALCHLHLTSDLLMPLPLATRWLAVMSPLIMPPFCLRE